MDIEYDHNKDAINLFKHGISLSEAARGSLRRVISLRKANKREVRSYALNN